MGQGGRAGRWRLQRRSPKNSRTGIQRMMSGGRRTGRLSCPRGPGWHGRQVKSPTAANIAVRQGRKRGVHKEGREKQRHLTQRREGWKKTRRGQRRTGGAGEERQETEGWGNIEGRSRVGIFIFFSSPGEAEADRTMYRRVVGQEAATAPYLSSGLTAGQTLTRVAGGCRAAYAACRQGCQGLAGQAASG